VIAADADRLDQIIRVRGPYHADRQLAVVGRVGGVQGAIAGVELDLAADVGTQVRHQGR
jgi:hypothetical protein